MDKLNKEGMTEQQFLAEYNPDKYKKPAVTVDISIFTIRDAEEKELRKLPDKKLKILMVKRKNHPFIGQWALPGGFVEIDESIDNAAKRELLEETGIDLDERGVYIEQLYTWGEVERDPRMRVISTSYISLFNSENINLLPGDDAEDAGWFEIHSSIMEEKKTQRDKGYIHEKFVKLNLINGEVKLSAVLKITVEFKGRSKRIQKKIQSSEGIAFDHALIIYYGLERLRNKVEYTDIAFNLVPECFTLTELQKVYEVLLGRELLKANFRRKIEEMVIETDKVKKDSAHRPAKLYIFNPGWDKTTFK